MAKLIDSLAFGESSYVLSIPFGTCTTSASTGAKTVTVENWVGTLDEESVGARVAVKFVESNTANFPTLDVNDTGPLQMRYCGLIFPTTQNWPAGAVVEFVYDGTYWNIVGTIKDNNTDTNYKLCVGTANSVYNDATDTNGNVYIKLIKNGNVVQDGFRIQGSGGTTVTSDEEGYITVTSTVSDNVKSTPVTSGTYYIVADSSSSTQTATLKKRLNVKFDASGNIIANNIPSSGLIWQTF